MEDSSFHVLSPTLSIPVFDFPIKALFTYIFSEGNKYFGSL